MEFLSTTSLANELDIKPSELFDKLKSLGWIERKGDKWALTDAGRRKGGQTRTSPKYGEFIVWPEDLSIDRDQISNEKTKLLNSTAIGGNFKVSNQRMNLIFSELGWIEKALSGWVVTKPGKAVGGRQFEDDIKGNTYVKFPDTILQNKILIRVFSDSPNEKEPLKANQINQQQQTSTLASDNFRDRFPATFTTKDGHKVRSRAEVIIDNALYDYKLAHAYERRLPIEEDLYSDFFIPSENVYIEFWGMEDDPKYAERKRIKLEIYKKYDFKLIELNDSDITNLDDTLPKKLLKYGIKVY